MDKWPRLIAVTACPDFRIFLRFDDGLSGEIDLTNALRGPVFEPLRDPAYFAKVRLSDYGAPVWPNGLNLAPDALHERLLAAGKASAGVGHRASRDGDAGCWPKTTCG